MTADECRDRIRYSLSDVSGTLRIESFDIADAPDCQNIADEVRSVILGRPIANIDVAELLRIFCPGKRLCVCAIVDAIGEEQALFAGTREQR